MKFEIYKDRSRRWRWRLRANNGNIMADSGASYSRRCHVETAAISVQARITRAKMVRL